MSMHCMNGSLCMAHCCVYHTMCVESRLVCMADCLSARGMQASVNMCACRFFMPVEDG